jgi:hypothetical protein
MNPYVRDRYGDPCRACGFLWALDDESCRRIIDDAPKSYAALLVGRVGLEQHPDLAWNASAYVAHVADNTRIWAERVAGTALGDAGRVVPYDEEALGRARNYDGLGLQGATWSLARAIGDWQAAEALADHDHILLLHPEQGRLELSQVRRVVAHELHHHAADLHRIFSD